MDFRSLGWVLGPATALADDVAADEGGQVGGKELGGAGGDGVAERDGESIGGVQAAREVLGAELEAEHFTDLALVALAVAGDDGLDAGGRVVVDGDAGEGGGEHGDGASLADGHGRADVLSDEGVLDGDDAGRVLGDEVTKLGEDVLQSLFDGPGSFRGDDVAGEGVWIAGDELDEAPPSDTRTGVDAEDDHRDATTDITDFTDEPPRASGERGLSVGPSPQLA